MKDFTRISQHEGPTLLWPNEVLNMYAAGHTSCASGSAGFEAQPHSHLQRLPWLAELSLQTLTSSSYLGCALVRLAQNPSFSTPLLPSAFLHLGHALDHHHDI